MKYLTYALFLIGGLIVGIAGDRWACDLQLAASQAPSHAVELAADRPSADLRETGGQSVPAQQVTQLEAPEAPPGQLPPQSTSHIPSLHTATPPPTLVAATPAPATPPPNPQTFLRVTVAGAPALQCYGTAQGFDCEDPRTYAMTTFPAGERLPYTRLLTDVRGKQFYILGPWTPVGLMPAEDAQPTT